MVKLKVQLFSGSSEGTTVHKEMLDISRTSGESGICNQLKSYNVTIEEAPEDSPEKNHDATSPDSNSIVSEPLEIDVVAELVKNGLINASELQPFMSTPISEALDQDDSDVVQAKASPIQKRKRGRPTVNRSRETPSANNVVTRSKRRQFYKVAKATIPDVPRNIDVTERKPMVSLLTGLKYDSLKTEADQEIGSGKDPACLLEPSGIKEEVTTESERKEVRSAPSPTKPTYLVLIPTKNSSESDSEIVTAQRTRTKGPKKHACFVCSKTCKTRSRLEQHLLVHTGQKPHVCPYCNKGFTNKSNLERHVKMHTGVRPHLCDLCGKGFIQKTSLLDHMVIHYEAKAYKCTMCELSYNRKTNLRQHFKRMHQPKSAKDDEQDGLAGFDAKRPFLCDLCGRGFATVVTLKFHKKLHAGDKPYICSMCKKGFVQKAQLDQHYRIHTGEKPYVCQTCGKAFVYKDSLTQHTRIHTGEKPYVCQVCSRSYTQSHHLKGHMLTHTGEKPYACQLCSKAYKNRADLRFHSSRVHQVNLPKSSRSSF